MAYHYCDQLRKNAFAEAFTLRPRFPRFTNWRRPGASALRSFGGPSTQSRRWVPQIYAECAVDESSSTIITDSSEDVSPSVCGSSFRQRNSSCSGSSHRNRQSPDSPRASETAEGDARTPPPRPSGTKLPLARAATKEQSSCTRNQIAGLISLVPHADDLW